MHELLLLIVLICDRLCMLAAVFVRDRSQTVIISKGPKRGCHEPAEAARRRREATTCVDATKQHVVLRRRPLGGYPPSR
jgi:hypothetical protein